MAGLDLSPVKSAKPFLLTGAVAALLILVAVILLQKDPCIDRHLFEAHLSLVLSNAHFQVLRESTRPAEEISLPLRIYCLPKYWFSPAAPSPPDEVKRYGLIRGEAGPVECLVRSLQGRAACVVIRYPKGQEALADDLHATLAKGFPSFPIEVVAPSR